MPEPERADEPRSVRIEDAESDPQMVALDEMTRKLLKVPKEELDALVVDDLARNRGIRRAKLT